jgi:hypothetical protein
VNRPALVWRTVATSNAKIASWPLLNQSSCEGAANGKEQTKKPERIYANGSKEGVVESADGQEVILPGKESTSSW